MKSIISQFGFAVFCIIFIPNVYGNTITHTVNISRNDFKITEQGEFDRITTKNNLRIISGKIGEPELPFVVVRFIIQQGHEIDTISITNMTQEKIKGYYNLYPEQDIPIDTMQKPEFCNPKPEVYNSVEPYPANQIEIINQGDYIYNRIVVLAVYPFLYIPANQELYYTSTISFTITTKISDTRLSRTLYKDEISNRIYESSLKNIVDNPQDLDNYIYRFRIPQRNNIFGAAKISSGALTSHNYIIITADSLTQYFEPFKNWVKRRGLSCGIVTTESIYANYTGDGWGLTDNAAKIRGYLHSAFQDQTDPVSWVLIGGDDSVVPVRHGTGIRNSTDTYKYVGPTDTYYADMQGEWDADNDGKYGEAYDDDVNLFFLDLPVGRVPALNGAEISNWIEKIFKYEQNPGNGNWDYLTKSYWLAVDNARIWHYVHENPRSKFPLNFSHTIALEEGCGTCYYCGINEPGNCPDPTAPSGSGVIDDMNQKFGFINWFAHGAPQHIAVRTKGNNDSGGPKYGVFLTDDLDIGSVIYVVEQGNSLDSLYNKDYYPVLIASSCHVAAFDWSPRTLAEGFTLFKKKGGVAFLGNTRLGNPVTGSIITEGFYDNIFMGNSRIGVAHNNSKMTLSGQQGGAHEVGHLNAMMRNLFGCPFMPVWTDTPSEFSPTVTVTASSVTINAGVSGSTIAVSSYDLDTLYVADDVTSETFYTSIRPLFFVITKPNYIPYVGVTGGTIDEDQIWGVEYEKIMVHGDISISTGKTLRISTNTTVCIADGKEFYVEGTLRLDNYVTMTKFPNGTFWAGVDVRAGGRLLNQFSTIEYATEGVNLSSSGRIDSWNRLTIRNCDLWGVRINSSSPYLSWVRIEDCGRHGWVSGGIRISGTSSPWIENITVEGGKLGIWEFGTNADMDLFSSNIFPGTDHCIRLDYHSSAFIGEDDDYGNNIVNPSGKYAIYHYGSTDGHIVAQYNYWGTTSPVDTLLFNKPHRVTYVPYSSYFHYGSGAGKTAPRISEVNPFMQGIKFERNSDWINALETYRGILSANADPSIRKRAIMRILRVYDHSNGDLDELRALIDQEMSTSDTHYRFSLECMQSDLFAREGKNSQAIQAFESLENKYLGEYKLYIYGRIASLYGDELNDKIKAKEYADKIFALDPSYPDLYHVYKSAGVTDFEPVQKSDDNDEHPIDDQLDDTEELENSVSVNPNPANPMTTIRYSIAKDSHVRLEVYSILGQRVAVLVDGKLTAGHYSAVLDGSNMASGIYLFRFETEGFRKTGRLLILK